MAIITRCHSCDRSLRVPDDLIGRLVECPTCGERFTATEEPEEAEPVPVEDRPSRRRRDDHEEDRLPPRRRPRRYEDEDDDYPSIRRRSSERPAKVQAIAIMMLVGGILAIISSMSWFVLGFVWGLATCGLGFACWFWPGPYYGLVMGIMATVKGSQLLGRDGHRQPPPRAIAIMQIINIVNFDVVNCVMGAIALSFLGDREVEAYYRG